MEQNTECINKLNDYEERLRRNYTLRLLYFNLDEILYSLIPIPKFDKQAYIGYICVEDFFHNKLHIYKNYNQILHEWYDKLDTRILELEKYIHDLIIECNKINNDFINLKISNIEKNIKTHSSKESISYDDYDDLLWANYDNCVGVIKNYIIIVYEKYTSITEGHRHALSNKDRLILHNVCHYSSLLVENKNNITINIGKKINKVHEIVFDGITLYNNIILEIYNSVKNINEINYNLINDEFENKLNEYEYQLMMKYILKILFSDIDKFKYLIIQDDEYIDITNISKRNYNIINNSILDIENNIYEHILKYDNYKDFVNLYILNIKKDIRIHSFYSNMPYNDISWEMYDECVKYLIKYVRIPSNNYKIDIDDYTLDYRLKDIHKVVYNGIEIYNNAILEIYNSIINNNDKQVNETIHIDTEHTTILLEKINNIEEQNKLLLNKLNNYELQNKLTLEKLNNYEEQNKLLLDKINNYEKKNVKSNNNTNFIKID